MSRICHSFLLLLFIIIIIIGCTVSTKSTIDKDYQEPDDEISQCISDEMNGDLNYMEKTLSVDGVWVDDYCGEINS